MCRAYIAIEPLTVVLCPPGEVAAADNIVKYKADNRPGNVVRGCRWRDKTGSAEDDGPVDVLQDSVVEPLLEQPLQVTTSTTAQLQY